MTGGHYRNVRNPRKKRSQDIPRRRKPDTAHDQPITARFGTLTVNAANISKITSSQLRNISIDGVVFDNLTFSNADLSTPEPSALATFAFSGLGVAGLLLNRKRRGVSA